MMLKTPSKPNSPDEGIFIRILAKHAAYHSMKHGAVCMHAPHLFMKPTECENSKNMLISRSNFFREE